MSGGRWVAFCGERVGGISLTDRNGWQRRLMTRYSRYMAFLIVCGKRRRRSSNASRWDKHGTLHQRINVVTGVFRLHIYDIIA